MGVPKKAGGVREQDGCSKRGTEIGVPAEAGRVGVQDGGPKWGQKDGWGILNEDTRLEVWDRDPSWHQRAVGAVWDCQPGLEEWRYRMGILNRARAEDWGPNGGCLWGSGRVGG